jgi:hypothetical protein
MNEDGKKESRLSKPWVKLLLSSLIEFWLVGDCVLNPKGRSIMNNTLIVLFAVVILTNIVDVYRTYFKKKK